MRERQANNYWRGALLLLMLAITASAQEFRGSLTGRVTDPTGAALPGAAVSIKNVETNITAAATTSSFCHRADTR